MRVLIVEDDAANRVTLAALLDADGFEVECAESVADGRGFLRTAPAYDCVILDRKLGDGHGLDLLPEVKERSPSARIVVLTGDRELVPPGVADLVVGKGEDLSGLIEVLTSLRASRGR